MGVIGRVRLTTRSDEHLLVRARQGDVRSFEEVHRRYRSSVFGYCLMRLSDRQAAEDATQEVFLKVSEASGAAVKNVKAWIFTVAHNVVIDASRRKIAAPVFTELETVMDSVVHSSDETAFSALDVTTNVYIALRQLPTKERRALIYREFQDWPSRRIADELDISPGNADVLVCRARAAFGRAYAGVVDLPLACRQATETIYREIGSGASDHRLGLMNAHMAICPRCRAEHRRAHSPRFLGGVVPWLWVGTQMDRLSHLGTHLTDVAGDTATHLNRLVLPGWSGTAKATVAIAIAATALAPGVVHYVAGPQTKEIGAGATISAAAPRRVATRSETAVGETSFISSSGTAHQDARLPHDQQAVSATHDAPHDSESTSHETGSVPRHAESSHSGSSTSKHADDKADSVGEHTSTTKTGSQPIEVSHSSSAEPPADPADSHAETDEGHE